MPSGIVDSTSSQESDPWIFVSCNKKRRPRRNDGSSYLTQPNPRLPSTLRSSSETAEEYKRIRSDWDSPQSPCCTALRALAAKAASAIVSCGTPVSLAICLGIGTFDPSDGGWDAKRRTYLQLIAFLAMVEELEKHVGSKISCIFQDPVFTSADRDFISSLGHRVVESPEACELVAADTFLFGVHLYRPIYAMALRTHLPAIFVGTPWDIWDEVTPSGSHDLLRLQEMDEQYAKAALPQDRSSTAFSTTSIYWRTTGDCPRSPAVKGKQENPSNKKNIPSVP